jgi:nucleoside-diphosphate-sugar epimerase
VSGHALIIGCGFLGRVLARQLRGDGLQVIGTVRRDSSVEALRAIDVEAVTIDITAEDGARQLAELARDSAVTDVYACVPPGIDADPAAVFTAVAAALRPLPLRRALLTSSTAVYGDHDGARVDADTPIAPTDPRGRRLFDIERAWLSIGQTARVVRLAGLYGPGRVIGAGAIRGGTAIGGNPDDFLNLIHVEDAAALLRAVASSDVAATIELGADGIAMTRRDYYNALAALLGTGATFEADGDGFGAARRAGSRLCDIAITCRRTGWHPRFADARLQIAGLLSTNS